MYKKLYSKFLKANEGKQHYAAHSHHYWPDVTFEAMTEYWNDSARLVDSKWDYILGTKVPQTQKMIANLLKLDHPENIVFSSNTHDFILRLISCFELNPNKKIKILTTDSEFYSFSRQAQRLQEQGYIDITTVKSEPFNNFNQRFTNAIKSQDHDLIFLSHVFFNSGVVVQNLEEIVSAVTNSKTIIVIDGYHSFMAIPTDLSKIQDRIFYITGSYKYAQGGEGCCFMTVPKAFDRNPTFTGWFAGFQDLENNSEAITFATDGYRFAGSTMDYTPLYRLHAVLKLYRENGITIEKSHAYVQNLQKNFLTYIDEAKHPYINRQNLIAADLNNHGHFLSFKMPSVETCKQVKLELLNKNIITDSRGEVLRFGFGLYQDDKVSF